MNNKEQDNYNNATLDLIKKFVDSNQRKRINSLTQIESEVENIFNLGPSLFDIFDNDGDDWAAGWILQVLKKLSLNSLKILNSIIGLIHIQILILIMKSCN